MELEKRHNDTTIIPPNPNFTPEPDIKENHAETYHPPSMDPNEYIETVKPPKGIYEEKAMRDLEARCKFFMEKAGHYAALNEEDEDPVKKVLLERGLKHEKIEQIKKLYPKTYQRYLDKKLIHKDNNESKDVIPFPKQLEYYTLDEVAETLPVSSELSSALWSLMPEDKDIPKESEWPEPDSSARVARSLKKFWHKLTSAQQSEIIEADKKETAWYNNLKVDKDKNDARTKRDREDSGGRKDKRREELDKYLDDLFEEEMAEAYNKNEDKNEVKDHRCNCENSHCKHPAGDCKNKSGHKKAMYIGSICDECAKNMPEKYMVK